MRRRDGLPGGGDRLGSVYDVQRLERSWWFAAFSAQFIEVGNDGGFVEVRDERIEDGDQGEDRQELDHVAFALFVFVHVLELNHTLAKQSHTSNTYLVNESGHRMT